MIKCLYRVLALALMLSSAAAIFAQVNQGELEQDLPPVTFINYEGPHSRIETREQIRQIGAGLGQTIKGGATQTGAGGRYFVIHSVSDPDGAKLDADIFGLGVDVGVDHIRNLRTIIQGYLQEAYGYAAADASLLAEYVTIYNAVYRGHWDYFTSRYKTPVIQNLDEFRAGLSVRYDEWPGRTLIVIPLGIGGLSAVDTTAISDNRVIEEMRKDDDRGVPQRQDMVDLKEREAAQAEQKAQSEREAAQAGQQQVNQGRAQVQEEKEQIAQERQQNQDAAASGAVTPEQAQKKEDELARRDDAADQKTAELDQRQSEVDQQKENAEKLQDFADQKTAEAQQDRESIAQDQQEAINDDSKGVIGVTIKTAGGTTGTLVRLDPASGKELKRSPLDTIYVRTLTFLGGKIFAIAGENKGNGAVRLIEINPGSLEMVKQGDDDMHPGSLVWANGNDLYAITMNLADGSLKLGRFNTDMALQATSQINMHPNAAITIQQGVLLTQKADGSAALLNPADLKEAAK